MLFSSNVFLFVFLPMVLGIYYLSPRPWRNRILLVFSLIFYGWGEPIYLVLMLAVIVMDYFCGLWIARCPNKTVPLAAGVTANLLILGYFKYAGLLFGDLLPQVNLPIGISFYIFQSMSYLIDIYRGDASVQKNLMTFGTYVTLFPQLIAGPIVRYHEVADALEHRKENREQFASGVRLFLCGLSKKMLLANPMGSLWNFAQGEVGTITAWVGLLGYSLQIYFDFSGYSDMAIGLGRMFGFEFAENFHYPYLAASITDFWRRWHISLSAWFREYVYIPLGGSRKGIKRQILNMSIVWLLTGIWHGASWNFLFWGGYYAIALILEKTFLLKRLQKLPKLCGWVYTMLVVMLGWALFYFENIGELFAFLGRLFRWQPGGWTLKYYLPMLTIAMVCAAPIGRNLTLRYQDTKWMQILLHAACIVGMLLCTASLARQSYNPFIYFRF